MYLNLYNYLIFIPLIFLTNSISIFLMSWMSLWMIMEINLISFIILLIFDKFNNYKIYMKYFLTQTFNSYIFLISSILMNFNELFSLMILFSMIFKLGLPPFHFWYIKILKLMSWNNIFLISTIQKIIPLTIISLIFNEFNMNNLNFIIMILMIFSMTFSILSINFMNIKTIMAYSSNIQMSWIIFLLMINEIMSITYFLIYSINMINLIYMFKKINLLFLNNFNKNFINKKILMFMSMSILSLAGLPPYFGFFLKWISIWSMFKKLNFFLIIWMIFISLISMFFYIRIIINSIYMFNISKKNNFKIIKFNISLNWFMIYLNWMIMFLLLIYEFF